LLDGEILTLAQLAKEFARSVEGIRRLMSQMPMDSATAGVELKASSAQVSQWRHYALQRLERCFYPSPGNRISRRRISGPNSRLRLMAQRIHSSLPITLMALRLEHDKTR